jgi:hypothetical protein
MKTGACGQETGLEEKKYVLCKLLNKNGITYFFEIA